MKTTLIRTTATLGAIALSATVAWAAGNTENGKKIYTTNCASCHGNGGKGDGSAAAGLNPKPRNLADKAYMGGLKDDYLVNVIKKGGAGVGESAVMPPWPTLKDGDVHDVIAFLRTLAQ